MLPHFAAVCKRGGQILRRFPVLTCHFGSVMLYSVQRFAWKGTHFSSGKAWSIVFMRRAVLLWGVFVLPGNGALFHAKVNILHVLSIKF
jgi:hypothetical protein